MLKFTSSVPWPNGRLMWAVERGYSFRYGGEGRDWGKHQCDPFLNAPLFPSSTTHSLPSLILSHTRTHTHCHHTLTPTYQLIYILSHTHALIHPFASPPTHQHPSLTSTPSPTSAPSLTPCAIGIERDRPIVRHRLGENSPPRRSQHTPHHRRPRPPMESRQSGL